MKSTIIFLGLALLTFNNGKAANELNPQDLVQQDVTTTLVDNAQLQNQLVLVNNEIAKCKYENNPEIETINLSDLYSTSISCKTMTEIIAENNLITETSGDDNYQPLFLELTLEQSIAEGNQIIESSVDTTYYPLDFEKINQSIKTNENNNKMTINGDLKL